MPIAYVSCRCGENRQVANRTSARSMPGARAPSRIESSRRPHDRSRRSRSTPRSVSGMAETYRWDALGTLVVTSLAIMGTPGPATISLTAAGSAYGVRRSLTYLAGIIAGTTVVLLAVATGITAALLAVPAVRPVLIAAGAGYIVWLAYHIATAPPLAAQAEGSAAPGLA